MFIISSLVGRKRTYQLLFVWQGIFLKKQEISLIIMIG